MARKTPLILVDHIEPLIINVRGTKVILDRDLAALYGVSTKALNQAVKRNRRRFPHDFVFRLTSQEKSEVVTKCDHLHPLRFSPQIPFAFTEYGAVMAANILNSLRATQISVLVVRTFVKIREMVVANKELLAKLAELERRLDSHDESIRSLVAAIRELMTPAPEPPPRRRIGFA